MGKESSVPNTLFSTAEGGTGTDIMSGEIKTSSDEVPGRATCICFLIWFW